MAIYYGHPPAFIGGAQPDAPRTALAQLPTQTTVHADITSFAEIQQSLTFNNTASAEWGMVRLADGAIPSEWRWALLQGGAIPTEWGITTLTNNLASPVEWRSPLIVDNGGLSEWRVALNTDSANSSEWLTPLNLYNSTISEWIISRLIDSSNTMEWGTIRLADNAFPAEWGMTRLADRTLSTEWGIVGAFLTSVVVPVEWQAALNLDAVDFAEWRTSLNLACASFSDWPTTVNSDTSIPLSLGLTLLANSVVATDWRTALSSDSGGPAEWRAALTSDNIGLAEWRTALATSSAANAEWSMSRLADWLYPAEILATTPFSAVVFVEMSGANATTVDNAVPLEWRSIAQTDTMGAADWRLNLQVDNPAFAEWNLTVRRDAAISVELLGSFVCNVMPAFEWRSAFVLDAVSFGEWLAGIGLSGPDSVEWSSTSFQITAVSPIEIQASCLISPIFPQEFSRSSRSDANVPAETSLIFSANVTAFASWTTTATNSYITNAEWFTTFNSAPVSFAVENGSGIGQVIAPGVEWSSPTLQGMALPIPIEIQASCLISPAVPQEFSGWLRRDASAATETNLACVADVPMATGWSTTAIGFAITNSEWFITLNSTPVSFAIENRSGIGSAIVSGSEWAQSLSVDIAELVEWLWLQATSSAQADAAIGLEWNMLSISDVSVPFEWSGSQWSHIFGERHAKGAAIQESLPVALECSGNQWSSVVGIHHTKGGAIQEPQPPTREI